MVPTSQNNNKTNFSVYLFVAFVLVAIVCTNLARPGFAQAEAVSFNRDIRPILSEHCFRCHGFDESHREADLRLDLFEQATSELDSGVTAIVPGDLDASELITRILSDDEADIMPPPEMDKPLSPKQIELLKKWVEQGAEYQAHWSLINPERPQLLSVKNKAWARNSIDRFILQQLDRKGIEPAPEVEKARLLRRVTLDLTGLPPTLEELDDFLADTSSDAYGQAVDRLLASKRYGEHRARYWLDAARYGDTHGMARDDERSIWPYRDWVVQAFNDNMPFDKFTIRQLAGDLLPNPTLEDLVATGFVRCNVSTSEGGSIDEEVLVNYAKDRVNTMATVWMGLTMGCASCHDHKYDPLTQKEYYQLVSFFNNLTEEPMNDNALAPFPVVPVPSPRQIATQQELDRLGRELDERKAAATEGYLESDYQHWRDSAIDSLGSMLKEKQPAPASWYESRLFRRKDNTRVYFDHDFGPERGVDLNDQSVNWHKKQGGDTEPLKIGKDNSAQFYYRELKATWPQSLTLELSSNSKRYKSIRWKVWLNGELIYFRQFRQTEVPFAIEVPLDFEIGNNELLVRASHFGGPLHGIIQLQASSAEPKQAALVEAVAASQRKKATQAQEQTLKAYFQKHLWAKGLEFAKEQLRLKQQQFALNAAVPVSMVCEERDEVRPTFLLNRGQYDLPGDRVERGVPAALPALPKGSTRLDLARWLVSDEHPLTARVTVNRIWQQFFGVGIVKTSEDLGSQGEWPSHPELLDWLAVDFRENGWDTKRLVRSIVTSATYRQASNVMSASREHDPENRLLARGPQVRLDAEVIRDQALFLGGLLQDRDGGRAVKPPQPTGLWLAVSQPNSSTAHFVSDPKQDQYYRSVYTFWKRSSPPPVLQTFDAPTREACILRRERTNTPLQALVLMNESQFFEAARALAQRILAEPKSKDLNARLQNGFRLVTSRQATKAEVGDLRQNHEQLVSHFQTHPAEAKSLIGNAHATKQADSAAWVMTANVLLNLSEVITKE